MEKYECRSTMDAIVNLLLREFAPLRTETRDVMIEGFGKDHPTYRSIISAIALGKTTKKEIGDFVEIKETSLSPYLYDLMEMADLVEYEIPVTEKKVWKTKRGRYVLKDPFFEFWFRFIFRNRSAYEIGNYDYLKSIIREQLDSFVGFGFEKVVREAVLLKKSGVRAGRWWNRKGDEIDLVCLNGRPVVIECKWQDKVNAAEELGRLKAKVALAGIPGEAEYLIVARSFLRKEDYCWDLGDLQRAFSGENPASS
jgi:AAA+ ATPase superfamily predicted ATPase